MGERDPGLHMKEQLTKDGKSILNQSGKLCKSIILHSDAQQEMLKCAKRMVSAEENMQDSWQTLDKMSLMVKETNDRLDGIVVQAMQLPTIQESAKELRGEIEVTALRMREGDARIAASLV